VGSSPLREQEVIMDRINAFLDSLPGVQVPGFGYVDIISALIMAFFALIAIFVAVYVIRTLAEKLGIVFWLLVVLGVIFIGMRIVGGSVGAF
jgi:hypothetical protein